MDFNLIKVSFFDQLKNTGASVVVMLESILDAIRSGKWEFEIAKLRAAPTKQAKDQLKLTLPSFTGSGTFSKRGLSGLIEHSGVIVLDLDKLENVEDARAIVNKDKHTYASFTSCSGKGLAVIVPIDVSAHTESYVALSFYYKERFGLIIDPSCKDVSRARFISHDPDVFINSDAEIFTVPKTEPAIDKEFSADLNPEASVDYSEKWNDNRKYEWCRKIIDRDKQYVDEEHHRYLFALANFLNKVGVSNAYALREMAIDFVTPSKTERDITSIVEHCYKRSAEFGSFQITVDGFNVPKVGNDEGLKGVYRDVNTSNREGKSWGQTEVDFISEKHKVAPDLVKNIFEFIYKSNADEFGLKNKPKIKQVEILLLKNFEFRDNIVSSQREFRRKGGGEFEPLNPDTINRYLQHSAISFALNQLNSLLSSDFVLPYNAFEEMFKSLPEWNQKTDYIDILASHVTADNQEFFNVQFKKMMVRSVACSLYGEVNRMIFVLVSPKQELGKSTFIRFLNPFKKFGYTETPLRQDKDTMIRMSENFIYNLEELGSLHVKNVNALKAIISIEQTKERRPYAHFEEERPRRCNFFGSTNQVEFLADVTNTRWLCFNILDIDWAYKKNVDIRKAWAQAYKLYQDGFDHQLTLEEKEFRDEVNRSFELGSDESDLITQHLYPVQKDDMNAVFMAVSDIVTFLSAESGGKFNMNRYAVGRAMQRDKFVEGRKIVDKRQARGYWVGLVRDLPKPSPKAISSKGDLFTEFDI